MTTGGLGNYNPNLNGFREDNVTDSDWVNGWMDVVEGKSDGYQRDIIDLLFHMSAVSGAYSADWSTVELPDTPAMGRYGLRINTDDGNAVRLYFYNSVSAAWELIGGVTDHGLLGGLSDNDHPQYLLVVDIDNTPVDSELAQPISSNWAYDHQNNPTDIKHVDDNEKNIIENLNDLLSAGAITGGAITDGGSETIDVASGTGMIRISNSPTAQLIPVVWGTETGLAIPTDTARHIGIEYNGGSPRVLVATSDSDFNEHDNFHLGDVINEGGVLHPQNIPHAVVNAVGHMIERRVQTQDPTRGSGLILGESADASRFVTVTAGSIWNRLTESAISAIDTSGADTFDIYYRNSPSGFIKVASQSAWDMDSFDDGSGTLATLSSANKRGVLWFYIEFDGTLVAQYGRAEYNTMAAAENEAIPNTAPNRISEHAMLIGRIIFQKDVTPAEQVDTVFTTFMTGTGVVDHDGLGNIQTDDHHTATVASDLNHNDLANLNAGTVYEHISASQLAALHPVVTTLDHTALSNVLTSQHHVKYTDAEALTQAQTLDPDHSTPIGVHAGAVDPHGDRAFASGLDHDHATPISAHLSGATHTDVQLTSEEVQDIAGPLVASGGTKTRISVVYDDPNGNMDFIVDDMIQSASDFNHNDLANLNAVTVYEHISATQVTALHTEPPEITQVNAEAGTATEFSQWSAERVKQAIAALESAGGTPQSILDEIAMVGSANAVWVNMSAEALQTPSVWGTQVDFSFLTGYENIGSTNFQMLFVLSGLPLQKIHDGSTVNLYVAGTRVGMQDCDASNFLSQLTFHGFATAFSVQLDVFNANYTTVGLKTDTFTAVQVGATYNRLLLYVATVVANANNLNITNIEAKIYYA